MYIYIYIHTYIYIYVYVYVYVYIYIYIYLGPNPHVHTHIPLYPPEDLSLAAVLSRDQDDASIQASIVSLLFHEAVVSYPRRKGVVGSPWADG